MDKITVSGNVLDDYTLNHGEEDSYAWTQVCDDHVGKFPPTMIDYGVGGGVCGVDGCDKEANHYIDFEVEDICL